MLTMAAVLVAVVAALVFVMRMDDDPTRWNTGSPSEAGRGPAVRQRTGEPAPARAAAPAHRR